MKREEFNEKFKEFEDQINDDGYYNANKKLYQFCVEVSSINEAIEGDFDILVGEGDDLSLDEEAREQIQKILLKRKDRMIEEF